MGDCRGMQSVPFNPGATRGTPRAVGSLVGLTPARSWRDDLLALLAERRSLVEVRDWATARGVHYRDEVLPLLEEWTEQGLLKTTGEAKEKRVWATKPGDTLPGVEEPAPCLARVTIGKPIALDELSPGMRASVEKMSRGESEVYITPPAEVPSAVAAEPVASVVPVEIPPIPSLLPVAIPSLPTSIRRDAPATFDERIDNAIIAALSNAGRPTKPADLRAVLGEFTYQQISRSGARLRYQKRMVTHGSTNKAVWSLPGWNNEPAKTAPATKPEAPPVEKTSLPQEERKPCSGKCHRDTKPVNPPGELVAIVLIGSREDVLPRLRAALDMVAKRDGE